MFASGNYFFFANGYGEMVNQLFLKIGTVAISGVLVALLASKIEVRPSATTSIPEGEAQPGQAPEPNLQTSLQIGTIDGASESADRERGPGSERPMDVTLRVGKIAATPGRDEITQIRTLPKLEAQVHRQYALAKAASCRMLTPGAAVLPTLTSPQPGQASTIGRVPSITVGLKMADQGRNKLPAVTRSQVDSYFRDHRLSIQPVVYCDAMGRYYFGTDCQAAFFELERPGTAIQPEPMIESAVARFRSLGVFTATADQVSAEGSATDDPAAPLDSGRTLAMAFTFEKSDQLVSGVASTDRQATEFLLFHLPESLMDSETESSLSSSEPEIQIEVFITSDDRRTLNRLDLDATDVNSPLPTISADIRFDKMILMGMYPAEPVVTQIHYRSAGVLSMDLIERLMSGSSDRSRLTLSEILDQFTLLSQSLSTPDAMASDRQGDLEEPSNGAASDEAWYEEMSRRKYDQLRDSLQPIERDAPF